MMVYLLTISYSVVAPLIVPFATIVFFAGFVTLKYLLLFVYKPKVETDGLWVNKAINMTIACIVIFQISTCGAVFVLSKGTTSTGFICSILLLCLPVLTLAFWAYLWFSIRKRADEDMGYGVSRESRLMSDIGLRIPSAYHPALCTTIPRVQVYPAQEDKVRELYRPAFSDIFDYMKSSIVDPERYKLVEILEKERKVQREFMKDGIKDENQGCSPFSTRLNSLPVPAMIDIENGDRNNESHSIIIST